MEQLNANRPTRCPPCSTHVLRVPKPPSELRLLLTSSLENETIASRCTAIFSHWIVISPLIVSSCPIIFPSVFSHLITRKCNCKFWYFAEIQMKYTCFPYYWKASKLNTTERETPQIIFKNPKYLERSSICHLCREFNANSGIYWPKQSWPFVTLSLL